MSSIKSSFVRVNATPNYMAYSVMIEMARVNGDQMYQTCKNGRVMRKLLKFSIRLPVFI